MERAVYSASQRAGHVPHPYGVCFTSKTKRPLSYCLFDSTRTEKRPVEAFGFELGPTVVSTLRTALDDDAYVRFWEAKVWSAKLRGIVWSRQGCIPIALLCPWAHNGQVRELPESVLSSWEANM